MKRKLTASDQERIGRAIADLERRTSAELAVAVARRSHDYATYPFLWAAGIALIAGGAVAVAWPETGGRAVVLLQGAVFILVYLALHLSPLGLALVPDAAKRSHSARLARSEFAAHVEGRTTGERGVLLFVALAERHIEILPDRGIRERIPPERWQAAVARFGAEAKARTVADALVTTIGECAALLAEPFPPGPRPRDELPNRLTEV